MKTKKILALALCAVMLVCISVGATVAYLTSGTDVVENTFTVGNVTLDDPDTENLKDGLDEAKVDVYGEPVEGAARVLANEYKLIPNHTYTKDPTVHVKTGSEPCYVYVKVVNGIDGIEAETEENGYVDIADQMTNLGWTQLVVDGKNVDNVFYYSKTDKNTESKVGVVDALTTKQDLVVFNNFKIADNADVAADTNKDEVADWTLAKITIDAYAIQADGFADAAAAWKAAVADGNVWEN